MKKIFSVFTDDLEHCYICGSYEVAIHHIFGASNRKRSEKYGFILPLHPRWHNMSNDGVHYNRELDLKFKRMAQEYFESHYGTRADFIIEFGKSYL
jgi:hypothetical protein